MSEYLKIKVRTDSRKEDVRKIDDSRLEIDVRESAENNLANTRVIEIVKKLYPGLEVRLVKGHHTPSKMFKIGA